MSPKVCEEQHLRDTNGKFVIKGPTGDWDPDEVKAVVTFVVTQSGNGTVAVGLGETVVYDRPPNGDSFVWKAEVKHVAGPAFRTGSADVHAWAAIAEQGGLGTYDCDQAVTIKP